MEYVQETVDGIRVANGTAFDLEKSSGRIQNASSVRRRMIRSPNGTFIRRRTNASESKELPRHQIVRLLFVLELMTLNCCLHTPTYCTWAYRER